MSYAEGTPVRYWRGIKGGAGGPGLVGIIRDETVRSIGGEDCQRITSDHPAGWIALTHIEALPIEHGAVHVLTAQEAFDLCDHVETDIAITDKNEADKLRALQKIMGGLR